MSFPSLATRRKLTAGTRSAVKRLAAAIVLFGLFGLGMAEQAEAQLSLPSAGPSNAPGGIRQEGAYFTAPITVDGVTIFRIATSIAADSAHLPISQRQALVQSSIADLLVTRGSGLNQGTEYDPDTLRIKIVHGGDVATLEAVDSRHHDPLAIVTVTSIDARYNQDTIDGVAAVWQGKLHDALAAALQLRQPEQRLQNLRLVGRVAAVLVVITVILGIILRLLDKRIKVLLAEVDEKTDAVVAQVAASAKTQEGISHQEHRNVLALALLAIKPVQELSVVRAVSATLYALINLMWFVALTWAFSLFPTTTSLARTLTNDLLTIAVIIVVTIFLDRVLDLAIARVANLWGTSTFADSEDRARQILRVPTVSNAVRAVKSLALVFVAGLTILTKIGVPVGSVVTIGGLIALALSLAAQSFVRDFVNGFLVLIEDQYVVGDYIAVTPASASVTYNGVVERLTLRMVQIRDVGGALVTIPHSQATVVVNKSRNWSRVDYRVPVDPASDVAKALALVQSSIEALAAEKDWEGAITLPIDLIGLDLMSKDWIIIRASVRTAPLRQFEVRRELNARVLAAFEGAGIVLGGPVPSYNPT